MPTEEKPGSESGERARERRRRAKKRSRERLRDQEVSSAVEAELDEVKGDLGVALRQAIAKNVRLEKMASGYRKRLVPEGAVVLQGQEAADWEAYKALGKPKELKGKLESADERDRKAQAQADGLAVRDFCDANKLNHERVQRFLKADGIRVKAEEKDGKKLFYFLVPKEGSDVPDEKAAKDFVASRWKNDLDYLRGGAATSQNGVSRNGEAERGTPSRGDRQPMPKEPEGDEVDAEVRQEPSWSRRRSGGVTSHGDVSLI